MEDRPTHRCRVILKVLKVYTYWGNPACAWLGEDSPGKYTGVLMDPSVQHGYMASGNGWR